MSKGALAKLLKRVAKEGVFTPFGSKDDIQNYVLSEVRRGALPKKRQEYFDTFNPNVYFHSTIQDIDKFDPQMDSSVGAYGDTLTRGATYFTSDRELANQVLDDKRILTQAQYMRQKSNLPMGKYPDFDFDTVYNPKTDEEFLSGSQIYPVKIKTDKIFDFDNIDDLEKLEVKIIKDYSDLSDEYKLVNRVATGDWTILERPQIQKALKELGFRGYKTSEPGTVGLFYPDEGDVRSLFAKFDPKDEKKGEILATVVPYASVGTIGALAGVDEGT